MGSISQRKLIKAIRIVLNIQVHFCFFLRLAYSNINTAVETIFNPIL